MSHSETDRYGDAVHAPLAERRALRLAYAVLGGFGVSLTLTVSYHLWVGYYDALLIDAGLGVLGLWLYTAARQSGITDRVAPVCLAVWVIGLGIMAPATEVLPGFLMVFLTLTPGIALATSGMVAALYWTGMATGAGLVGLVIARIVGQPVGFAPPAPALAVGLSALYATASVLLMRWLKSANEHTYDVLCEQFEHHLAVNEDLRSAEAAAREAALRKTEFLAIMSHELRTPLNGVLGAADILAGHSLVDQDAQNVLALRAAGTSFLRLLQDVLDIQRIEAGREVQHEMVDLYGLVRQLLDLLRPHAKTEGIALEATFAPDLPRTVGTDPVLLRQVLSNLLGHAVKHAREGLLEVHVSSGLFDDGELALELSVQYASDPAGRRAIQRWRDRESPYATVASDGGPVPVGLSVAYRCAELLEGALSATVDSAGDASFSFVFPATPLSGAALEKAEEAASDEIADARPPEPPVDAGPMRVLVAEDNPVNLMVVRRMLEMMGHEVSAAKDGVEAVEAVASESFDAVLMDCEMPRMDGIEATRQIRAAGHTLPIIALTAHAVAELRESAFAAGIDLWITKPVLRDTLEDALVRARTRAVEVA